MIDSETLRRRHLRFGWWALVVFVCAGTALEAMHGFKVAWYLDVGQETRRLLWRLAHAHGTFVALLNIAFALSVAARRAGPPKAWGLASPCFLGAGIALPAGFFLGGVDLHGGDPGVGIFAVPIGALLLLVAVVAAALGVSAPDSEPGS